MLFGNHVLVGLLSLLFGFNDLLLVEGVCPYLLQGTPAYPNDTDESLPDTTTYNNALSTLNISAVFDDIYELLYDSQTCWPADSFNGESSYTGLFLRLAWHCSGTYRNTSGATAGGCTGGRQRYEPEASWKDNTNLDKARGLVGPIKEKYGDALSWGDLFIFAGTAAVLRGGGPVTRVCAGRIDNTNGSLSEALNDNSTCNIPGNCTIPLGTSTVGLIYVNPQGYLANPDPTISAAHIRDVFGRMGVNDSATVALIGGGHAFGKSHGACPAGAGATPREEPYDPYPGMCGTDFPTDTFTSGMEGQWTTNPFVWDNEYFTQLVNDTYTLITGPGGNYQWKNDRNGNMMFTTDIALTKDPSYLALVTEFANDISALESAFSNAWETLVTSGGHFAANTFCVDAETLRRSSSWVPLRSQNGKEY